MRNAQFPHTCMPSMAATLKSVTRWWECAISAYLTANTSSRSFVDGFKDEVRSHAAAQKADKTLVNDVELEDGFAFLEGERDDCCGSN